MHLNIPLTGNNIESLWQTPPEGLRGDPSAITIYTAVGEAITAWESAQDKMADIYGRLSLTNQIKKKYTFGSETSHHKRSIALREAADNFFEKNPNYSSAQNALNLLMVHLDNASKIRNDIAHWVVRCFPIPRDSQCFLVPSESNSRKLDSFLINESKSADLGIYKIKYKYNSTVINEFRDKFHVLEFYANIVLGLLPPMPTYGTVP